jgi:hypothetical protein
VPNPLPDEKPHEMRDRSLKMLQPFVMVVIIHPCSGSGKVMKTTIPAFFARVWGVPTTNIIQVAVISRGHWR